MDKVLNKQIRFGIMCNGTTFPEWQANSIQSLLKVPGVTCEILISPERSERKKGFFSGIRFRNYLWKIYKYTKRGKFLQDKKVSLNDTLGHVKTLKVKTEKKGEYSEYFSEEDIKSIRDYDLDFILRYSFGILRGEILNVARFGIWSFHHGDEQKYRGGPPGFWEIYKNDPVTGAILQRLTEKLDGGIVLRKGLFKTKLSYTRNRDQIYAESSLWPSLVCKDILLGNIHKVEKEPSSTLAPIFKIPTNRQLIVFLVLNFFKRIWEEISLLCWVDYWEIGVSNSPISHFLYEEKPEVIWLKNENKGSFRADPFGLTIEGKDSIIFEEYFYKKNKGIISSLDGKGDQNSHKRIREEEFHLSYPYILEYDSKNFVIPESADSGKVRLFEIGNVTGEWNEKSTLIENFAAVDTSIVYWDNKWWMFVTNKEYNPHYNLHLFYSDSLFEDWKPHPLNPVKTDITSSRPAGSFFQVDGRLYRPSMNYSIKNQGSIMINRIDLITTTDFKETPITHLEPYKDSYFKDKIHTLSTMGDKTLVDGGRQVFFLKNKFFFELGKSKIKKRFRIG